MTADKQPISVLVVIYTLEGEVLLLERARQPGLWQSVTGSREASEALAETACREVGEETGITVRADEIHSWHIENSYEIFATWRHRYAPGVSHNTEYVYGLALNTRVPIRLAPDEHRDYRWLSIKEAAESCFSWSNRDAIRLLSEQTLPPLTSAS